MGARLELFVRILLAIVLEIIIKLWKIWVGICWVLQFLMVLVTGKRNSTLYKHIEKYFKFYVKSYEYLWMLTDKRPL